MKHEKLLSPFVLRGKVVKNRMASANSLPHFLMGPESFPADSVVAHYANRAKAGAAIVTCMGINNYTRGSGMPTEMDVAHFPDFDLYEPAGQNYLIQLADAIHYHGSIACMGFFVGPQSGYPIQGSDGKVETLRVENPVGVMAFPGQDIVQLTQEFYEKVHAIIRGIDEETMNWIADSYAQQCRILKWLGFDMASIHFAYRAQIPTKFLSPLTNTRTDEYGGSLENRARFPLAVLRRIREEVGEDFILEMLLSGEEPEGGYGREDAAAFIKMAEPYVDIVQVRAPEADPNHPTGFNLEETPFLEMAEDMKRRGVKMLVGSVGGWHYPDTAERALREGKIDIISMARAWVSNPDYGNLIYKGRVDDIVPCLRCNKCHGRAPGDTYLSICSVNPVLGIEHRLHYLLSEPSAEKKVAVVGGGPAGMRAAVDMADRGHKVILFEASDTLGGAIRHSDHIDFKWPLKDFKDYLIGQVKKRPIDVRLNSPVTPGDVKALGVDVVVVAIGAAPVRPGIPGADGPHVVFAQEAIEGAASLGRRVVVVGGGEVGMETGMHLAQSGHEVTVLEMGDELAPDTTMIHYRSMFQDAWEQLEARGSLKTAVRARVTRIEDDAVRYIGSGDGIRPGEEMRVPADSVVLSVGVSARREEALSYYGSAPRFCVIGDCDRAATIYEAMRSAYAVAHSM